MQRKCEPRPQRLLKSLSHCNSWHTDYGWNYKSPFNKKTEAICCGKMNRFTRLHHVLLRRTDVLTQLKRDLSTCRKRATQLDCQDCREQHTPWMLLSVNYTVRIITRGATENYTCRFLQQKKRGMVLVWTRGEDAVRRVKLPPPSLSLLLNRYTEFVKNKLVSNLFFVFLFFYRDNFTPAAVPLGEVQTLAGASVGRRGPPRSDWVLSSWSECFLAALVWGGWDSFRLLQRCPPARLRPRQRWVELQGPGDQKKTTTSSQAANTGV